MHTISRATILLSVFTTLLIPLTETASGTAKKKSSADCILVIGGKENAKLTNHPVEYYHPYAECDKSRQMKWAKDMVTPGASGCYLSATNQIVYRKGNAGMLFDLRYHSATPIKSAGDNTGTSNAFTASVGSSRCISCGGYNVGARHPADACFEYNSSTHQQWASIHKLPQANLRAAAVALGNNYYVCGGFQGAKPNRKAVATLYRYDALLGRWDKPKLRNMPSPRVFHSAAALSGDEFIVCGGGSTHLEALKGGIRSCHIYNETTEKWRQAADMKQRRSFFVMVKFGETVYAIGGHINQKSVEAYDKANDKWEYVKRLEHGRYEFVAFAVTLPPKMTTMANILPNTSTQAQSTSTTEEASSTAPRTTSSTAPSTQPTTSTASTTSSTAPTTRLTSSAVPTTQPTTSTAPPTRPTTSKAPTTQPTSSMALTTSSTAPTTKATSSTAPTAEATSSTAPTTRLTSNTAPTTQATSGKAPTTSSTASTTQPTASAASTSSSTAPTTTTEASSNTAPTISTTSTTTQPTSSRTGRTSTARSVSTTNHPTNSTTFEPPPTTTTHKTPKGNRKTTESTKSNGGANTDGQKKSVTSKADETTTTQANGWVLIAVLVAVFLLLLLLVIAIVVCICLRRRAKKKKTEGKKEMAAETEARTTSAAKEEPASETDSVTTEPAAKPKSPTKSAVIRNVKTKEDVERGWKQLEEDGSLSEQESTEKSKPKTQ